MTNLKTDYVPLPQNTLFPAVGIVFVAVLLISNVAAQKLFACGPFTFSGGIILFPIAYIFGDVLTEVYGYARARQVIWAGLACNVFMALILWVVIVLPPAPGWPLQEQFSTVLDLVPRVVFASVVAYWAGEFANSFVMAKIKIWMDGKALWVRTISSTAVGQAVDTILFVLIAFAGIFPAALLFKAIWSGYLFKVAYEAVATPFTYLIVGWLKRVEGIDVFDRHTRFNPFSLKVEIKESLEPSPTKTGRIGGASPTMPKFNFAADRKWSPSSYFPESAGWVRTGLYNDRPRTGPGKATTIVRHEGPCEFDMPPLNWEYEVFLLKGDVEIDGTRMTAGDHCLIAAGERVRGRTISGCEHLIIAR